MAQACFLGLTRCLIDFHLDLLKDVAWVVQELEQSHQELEQKLDQQAVELKAKNQQLHQASLELQHMQNHLIQAEKLSMLGQMVAGISHEINNPINFICGNLPHAQEHIQDLLKVLQAYQAACPIDAAVQTVLDDVDLDFVLADLPRVVNSMKLGTDRIRELVLTLRNFYRLDESAMKAANLHEGLENTLLLLHNRYNQKIEIVQQFGDIPPVECYINQLNQVFMNLIGNAIDALLEETANHRPKQIIIATQQLGTERVTIRISDNGCGMPIEVQQHLFEPFFTTKPMGIGTGLGLSISHQIVTKTHQGRIYCCSSPGQGTTFVVELPICQLTPTKVAMQGVVTAAVPVLQAESNSAGLQVNA